jgi:hypothetical protein
MTTYTPLRMIANDEDDLQIIAACLQDALVPLSGMIYDSEAKNFHLIANRFCWECPPEILEGDTFYRRVSTGIAFHHVTEIKQKDLNLQNKNELVNLLTIHDGQNNEIHLVFSGGAEIRLTIGKISCHLKDVDEPYHTPNKPSHESPSRL